MRAQEMIIFIHLQISICNDSGESTFNVYMNTKTSLIRVAFTFIKSHIQDVKGISRTFHEKKKVVPTAQEIQSFSGWLWLYLLFKK